MFTLLVCLIVASAATCVSAQTKTATTTTLAVTAGGEAASNVASGTVVTLTATVNAGATALTKGQVNFCDASATYCTDIHILGMAQITSAGTATLKLRPGLGNHSYKAVFLGTNTYAGSASETSTLTATGKYPTTTTIVQLQNMASYTLTATVTGIVNASGTATPTGSVSFVDTTNNNSVLGNEAVSSGTVGLNLSGSLTSVTLPGSFGIATADFNGDGIPDLAVGASNGGPAVLNILLGNGDGTFTAVTPDQAVGDYPYAVIAGDFNGDGIPDLAAGNVDDNTVSILLGNGNGTFTVIPNLNVSDSPQSLGASDFNGDGIPDLAVVTRSSVLVFIGNGDGTFQPTPDNLSVGSVLPQGIAIGDLNGDGFADLIVANDVTNGSVTVFLGNGDGTFKSGSEISGTGGDTVGVAVADFNRDGIPDLAVTNYSGDSISILLGNGNGTFQTPVPYAVNLIDLHSVTATDINGDGIADLAIGSGYASVAILVGKGDGTFGSPYRAGVSGFLPSGFLAVADFNGDGLPDVAEPNQTPAAVAVFLNQQSDTVTAILNIVNPPGPGTHNVEASYSGDSHYSASTSATVGLVAALAPLTISPAGGAVFVGQQITISESVPGATIYYYAGGAGFNTNGYVPYTGPILLKEDGILGLQAYADETGYLSSTYVHTSFTVSTPVGTGVATVSVTPSIANLINTQTLTVAVAVNGASGQPTPTGSLTLSTGSWTDQQTLSSGSATFTVPAGTLGVGSNTLTASYSGDTTYAAASGTSTVTVSPVIATGQTPSAISPGGSASSTISFSAGSTYSGTMNLTCALTSSPNGAQSLPTCNMNPTSVTLASGANGTSTLTVKTTAASTTALVHPFGGPMRLFGGGGATLAMLLLFGIPTRRRRWTSMFALLLAFCAFGIIGCGGGNSGGSGMGNTGGNGGGGGQTTPATTAGNYTFTVTGTDSVNPQITTSTTVVVTVQ